MPKGDYEQNRRARENALRRLPRYRDSDDEISEVKVPGGTAKLPIPRLGRLAIGIGLGFLFASIGVAIVLRFWPR